MKLLVAPAGYGKSTLARQWTAARPRAWYRVSPAAADVASVSRGIAIAAGEVLPGCNARLEERLRITKNPDAEYATLAEMLSRTSTAGPRTPGSSSTTRSSCWSANRHPSSCPSLLRDSRVNALMCTRQRPAWITARDLLYGHALEIGRNSLAMTHEEAAAVMPDIAATPGVVALADGWPAVVGLASLMPEPTLMSGMTAGLPEALYDYLAEELYQSLPPPIQDSMCLIAVAGVRSRQLVEQLFPARDREKTLRDVVDAGWLTTDADGKLELHPLLEAFLRQKLDEAPTAATRAKSKRIAQTLTAERQWDEAFSVIERYGIDEELLPLLRAALDDLLASGRTAALQEWVAYAERRSIAGPELDLSSAELLFREGRFHESEVRALAAAAGARRATTLGRAAAYAREPVERRMLRIARHAALRALPTSRRNRLLGRRLRVATRASSTAAIDLELPEAPRAPRPTHAEPGRQCRVTRRVLQPLDQS